jgi:L-ascorbate metabolism protein UlaG (beta-lactamase superfamily)
MIALPFARPRLSRYAQHFQPEAPGAAVTAVFLGTSSVLLRDSETSIMTDGFFTRPGLRNMVGARVAPDSAVIDSCLERLRVDSLAALFCCHSHYDHALDAAVVASRTGAMLLGSGSTANIGRGGGLPEEQIRVVAEGEPLVFGNFTLTAFGSLHSPDDRAPGVISEPLVPPAKFSAWKSDTSYSLHVSHRGRSLLIHASANYVPGMLSGIEAETVYLGIATLGKQPRSFRDAYWEEVVRAVGARRVIVIHWDDFWRPLDRPLRPLPAIADDMDSSMAFLLEQGERDGVEILIPVAWRVTDPFGGR